MDQTGNSRCFHARLNRQEKLASLRMDTSTCFCVAASVVFAFTLLWTLWRGHGPGAAVFVACLYFTLPPVVHGVLMLIYSSFLVWISNRRSELLPVNNRAVLVTGNTPPPPR